MERKIDREVVLLVAGSVAVLFGWILLANTEQIALAVLGCGHQGAPGPFGQPGQCFGTSSGERILVQIAGMSLSIGGVVAILVGALNYRTRVGLK